MAEPPERDPLNNEFPAYEGPDPDRPASSVPTEGMLRDRHDPYAALRLRDCRNYLIGSFMSTLGTQMLTVAIAWEIYERTKSVSALGLVGLVQAIPIILFAIPAGQVSDMFKRKPVVIISQLVIALCSLALAFTSFFHTYIPHWALIQAINGYLAGFDQMLASLMHLRTEAHFTDPSIPIFYMILLVNGIGRSFNEPARNALLPGLVPIEMFTNAATWSSSGSQTASVIGPALGGFLAYVSYPLVYLLDAIGNIALVLCLIGVHPKQIIRGEKLNVKTVGAGLKFVWNKQIILATITLDLFAVLLGGAVALLPAFADLLGVGSIGLGFLRAAPAVGALLMALVIAHVPPMKKAGRDLLWAVVGFGVATVVFGLTPLLPGAMHATWGFGLALVALFFTGVFDNISVVIRHTLVQVLTPDSMRGRVSAVNNVFIGSSNEIGAFESGISAAIFGPIVSVVAGGIGTVLVVIACAMTWKELRQFGSLADVHEEPEPVGEAA